MSALPTVSRCVCGHVYEWHYAVHPEGGFLLDHRDSNRCADWTCECKRREHDGNDPQQLPAV